MSSQDTTGRSLESLDGLFRRPWYTVYKVAYPTPDDMTIEGSHNKVSDDKQDIIMEDEKNGSVSQVEDVRQV